MDMNVGNVRASEMPFEPNIGKPDSSQPTLKAQLPAAASEVTLSNEQMTAINDTKFESEDALAITSSLKGNIDVAPKVAAQADSIFKK